MSEAFRGTQRHSAALRGTQRYKEPLRRSRQRHQSEAITFPHLATAAACIAVRARSASAATCDEGGNHCGHQRPLSELMREAIIGHHKLIRPPPVQPPRPPCERSLASQPQGEPPPPPPPAPTPPLDGTFRTPTRTHAAAPRHLCMHASREAISMQSYLGRTPPLLDTSLNLLQSHRIACK